MSEEKVEAKGPDTSKPAIENMVSLDPAKISQRDMYRLLIGSIVPRPIAFVSSCDGEGRLNVAPYSFFNGVSSKPPCLMIGVGPAPQGKPSKDTLRNIREQGEFVVNTVSEWFVDDMVHCASDYPFGTSELEGTSLHTIPSEKVKAPRIKESPVHFECVTHKLIPIDDEDPEASTLVLGRIVMVHVMEEAYDNGRVLFEKIKPVARLGGFSYGRVLEPYDRQVPKFEG